MARTFRNGSTRSTPLDPKLMFQCISYHRVRSLRKIPTRLCGTNFCTSSARFARSFVRQINGPECTQILRNAPKRQFRVQLGGSGAFVAKMHPNSMKTQQNVSLGSNGEDRVRSLRKITTRLCGTNYCTSSAHFAPSFVRQPNGPECNKIVRNAAKRQFRVQRGGLGAFVAKISDATSWHELLH